MKRGVVAVLAAVLAMALVMALGAPLPAAARAPHAAAAHAKRATKPPIPRHKPAPPSAPPAASSRPAATAAAAAAPPTPPSAAAPPPAPSQPPAGDGRVVFKGGDGSSLERAIVIQGARNEREGVQAEYEWILNANPHAVMLGQHLTRENGRSYDVIEFRTTKAQSRHVYFDVSGFLGKF